MFPENCVVLCCVVLCCVVLCGTFRCRVRGSSSFLGLRGPSSCKLVRTALTLSIRSFRMNSCAVLAAVGALHWGGDMTSCHAPKTLPHSEESGWAEDDSRSHSEEGGWVDIDSLSHSERCVGPWGSDMTCGHVRGLRGAFRSNRY